MGLMLLVGYLLLWLSLILYILQKYIQSLKKHSEQISIFAIVFLFIGLLYMFLAIGTGDPMPFMEILLWSSGIIILAVFTGIGTDTYKTVKGYFISGKDVRNYYSSLRDGKDKEKFKYEEKRLRDKIERYCPIFENSKEK